MATQIQKVGIAGAGAMGSGITQVFALAGIKVILYDVDDAALERAKAVITEHLHGAVTRNKITKDDQAAALQLISFTTDIHHLKADMIIEAVVEQLEAKQQLFEQLAELNEPACILASNTSSIPITRIAKAIAHPERVVGMHFFNPAHVMKLVEIISGAETSRDVAQRVKELALQLGKTPVMCHDSPGFIVNRVARHYYVESLKLLEERATSFENIDALMESAGFKLGPFKLMDLVGNDINFAVTASLFESFHHEPKFRPSRIQQQKVEAGHLGKKSRKGFYNYS